MRIEGESVFSLDAPESKQRELEQVAREFEALLMAEVLQNLSDSVASGSEGDDASGKLEGVLWLELARQLTEQRQIGLADAIYRQLSPDAGVRVDPAARLAPDAGDAPPAGLPSPVATPERPVEGAVSSRFGSRSDPFDHSTRFHHGVDLAAPEGATVTAAKQGRVVFAGAQPGYGNVVIVEHADGIRTLYAHLSRIDVQPGGTLSHGSPLGAVGSTGRATGAHLHFEVRKGDVRLDPEVWLQSG